MTLKRRLGGVLVNNKASQYTQNPLDEFRPYILDLSYVSRRKFGCHVRVRISRSLVAFRLGLTKLSMLLPR